MGTKRAKLTDQMRQIIKNCGQTRYAIAKATGISQATLARLVSGDLFLSAEPWIHWANISAWRFASFPRQGKVSKQIMASISSDGNGNRRIFFSGPKPQTQDRLFGQGADEDGPDRTRCMSRTWRPRSFMGTPRTPRPRSGWAAAMT